MKRSLLFVSLFLSAFAFAQNNAAYFLSNPCLTPDGATVIFSFEGDLWKASIKDGQASSLTAMQGYETSASVSPDGKWIAFTGRQYGNADVFVMPVNGGEVKQITYHSGNDDVTSWSWDSKSIYFNSNRMGQIAGFKVGAEWRYTCNGFLAIIFSSTIITWLSILPAGKYFLTIPGKAATRHNVKDIKGLSIPIFNL